MVDIALGPLDASVVEDPKALDAVEGRGEFLLALGTDSPRPDRLRLIAEAENPPANPVAPSALDIVLPRRLKSLVPAASRPSCLTGLERRRRKRHLSRGRLVGTGTRALNAGHLAGARVPDCGSPAE